MAKRNVDVAIRARDQASKKFRTITGATAGLTKGLRNAAAAAAAFFGTRALFRFGKESVVLFGRQEEAVISLADALENLGLPRVTKEYEDFATQIQEVTRLGDEQVLELQTMGATMAKLSGKELRDATKASIGLAKAFKVDVVAAMRLVARAAVGDTGSLSRYGITLDTTLTKQQKFNAVLKIGADNFDLAKGSALTFNGQMEQTGNIIGDVRELIGSKLAPTVLASAKIIRDWAKENQDQVGVWAERTVTFVTNVKNSFVNFAKFMKNDFTNAMKFVWDSFLILMKAAFAAAVVLSVAAGKAIGQNITSGIFNSERTTPSQISNFKAAGGQTFTTAAAATSGGFEGDLGLFLQENFRRISGFNVRERFIRNRDIERFRSFQQPDTGPPAFSTAGGILQQGLADVRSTSQVARGQIPQRQSLRTQARALPADRRTPDLLEKILNELQRRNSVMPGQGRLQVSLARLNA